MSEDWIPGEILIHNPPDAIAGYLYHGLGLFIASPASPKGRRSAVWSLTHLQTGHRICLIIGTMATAFPIATEVADCSDWNFDGLDGWKNLDPELPEKVRAILKKYPETNYTGDTGYRDPEMASAVLMARSP